MLVFEYNYTGSDKQSFLDKVNSVAFKLGIDPNWLMFIMNTESGLNPAAVNNAYTFSGGGHAAGLNQMAPATLQGLGFNGSWQDFIRLSGTDQMDWVYLYLKPYAGRIKSYRDLYLINLYPAYLGLPTDTQFPQAVVNGNKIFDVNKDGTVTIGELNQFLDDRVQRTVPSEFLPNFISNDGSAAPQPVQWNFVQTHERDILLTGIGAVIIAFIFFIIFLLVRHK